MEAETRYADSDGVSIAYLVHGDGPLDLVLAPGFVSQVELIGDDVGSGLEFEERGIEKLKGAPGEGASSPRHERVIPQDAPRARPRRRVG